MAGDWISMRTNLATDPRVVRMAARLKITRTAVAGAFWALWSAASEHGEGGRIPNADADTIDALTETPGFSDAAVAVKWLEFDDAGAICPRWSEHNDGASAKVRARERDKKRRQRTKNRRFGNLSPSCPDLSPGQTGTSGGQAGDRPGTCTGQVSHTDIDTDIDIDKKKNQEGGAASQKAASKLTQAEAKEHPTPMGWSPDTRAAWEAWLESRYATGKPMTKRAIDMALAKLGEWPPPKVLAALRDAAVGGWQGIYEPKASGKGSDVRGNRKHEVVGDGDESIDIPIYRQTPPGGVPHQAPGY